MRAVIVDRLTKAQTLLQIVARKLGFGNDQNPPGFPL